MEHQVILIKWLIAANCSMFAYISKLQSHCNGAKLRRTLHIPHNFLLTDNLNRQQEICAKNREPECGYLKLCFLAMQTHKQWGIATYAINLKNGISRSPFVWVRLSFALCLIMMDDTVGDCKRCQNAAPTAANCCQMQIIIRQALVDDHPKLALQPCRLMLSSCGMQSRQSKRTSGLGWCMREFSQVFFLCC